MPRFPDYDAEIGQGLQLPVAGPSEVPPEPAAYQARVARQNAFDDEERFNQRRLQRQAEFDEAARAMPPGATGFAASILQSTQKGDSALLAAVSPATQSVDLQDGGPLPAHTINRALDRITMWGQRLKEQVVVLGALAGQTAAGLMSAADKTKLDGIQPGAQVNVVTSVVGKTGAVALVKNDVGLGNVDNTSDLNKPISTATQAILNTKPNTSALAAVAFSGAKTDVGLGNLDNTADINKPVSTAQAAADTTTLNSAKAYTDSKANKASVGLGNVDNTSDLTKPVSNATQAALDLKANISSLGTAAFQPSTAFATAAQGAKTDTALQGLQAGLNIEIDNTDPLRPKVTAVGSAVGGDVAGPAGGVVANEMALFDGTTGKLIKGSGVQLANVAKVSVAQTWTATQDFSGTITKVKSLAAGVNLPGDDQAASTKYLYDFFVYLNANGAIVPQNSPVLTGNPTAPTPAAGGNDASIATAAFVQGEINARPKLKTYSANATFSPSDTHSIIRLEGGTAYNLPDNSTSPKSIEYAIFNATNAAVTITAASSNYLYTRDGISSSGGSYTLAPYGAILVSAASWDWYILENKRIPGIPVSYIIGDLIYADSTATLAALASVAGGNVLRSGGIGTAPSWGKVGLTTHVSGTLPVPNGGTGATALATTANVQSGAAFIPTMDVVLSAMGWAALIDGATIAVDHAGGINRTVTIAGNRIISNPTNAKPGWPLNIEVTQDSTGGRTLSWGANFSFGAGGAPALSTAASAADLVCFVCRGASKFVYTGIIRGI